MTPSTSTSLAVHRVPLADVNAFPRLVQTYCTDYEAVAGFYAGDFRDPAARRAAAERAAAYDRDREALVEILHEQNDNWGADETTRQHIDQLLGPEAVAVVTGQQVGLLTGPLYTILKTITALELTGQLAEETGRPVVPVFWVEGEDHDFGEIASTHLLHRNDLVTVRYDAPEAPANGNLGAVGRLVLGDGIHEVLDEVDDALPPSDFKPDVMARVREAYQPGTTLEDAFTRLMRALFPDAGLVFINPDDARLKAMARPLFRRDIEDYETPVARVREASEALSEAYHAQVHARPTNLFMLDDTGRHPIDAGDEGYALRGTDRRFTKEDLLAKLDEAPEQFSPNVVLRPLMQDLLLPTAAYVAGPGEMSYFAQYKGVYEWAGVPMPIIYPRATVSLVESKVQKVLDKYSLGVSDMAEDVDALFQRVVMQEMEVDVEEVFSDAMRHVHQAINDVKPIVEDVDRTLVKSAEATRAALMEQMNDLKSRVVRAEKRQHDEVRDQLAKARINLRPSGTLQERKLSVLYYLNKYSPALIDDLRTALSLDTTAHQVVEL